MFEHCFHFINFVGTIYQQNPGLISSALGSGNKKACCLVALFSCFFSGQEIARLIMEGNAARTVASTNMNAESSRSHAVFNVVLTQTVVDVASGVSGAKVNWILIFLILM